MIWLIALSFVAFVISAGVLILLAGGTDVPDYERLLEEPRNLRIVERPFDWSREGNEDGS